MRKFIAALLFGVYAFVSSAWAEQTVEQFMRGVQCYDQEHERRLAGQDSREIHKQCIKSPLEGPITCQLLRKSIAVAKGAEQLAASNAGTGQEFVFNMMFEPWKAGAQMGNNDVYNQMKETHQHLDAMMIQNKCKRQ